MIYPLSAFVGCGLRCRARARAGEVMGFVVDDRNWSMPYVQVRLASDPAGMIRLLPSAAFPAVARFEGELSACLTGDELTRGLELGGSCEALTHEEERALHDRLHWVPYWSTSAERPASILHDAARALGAELSCCDEKFGKVDDLIVETSDWKVSALSIATSPDTAVRGLHLPVSFIRTADWERRHFDSDVRAAALACAPEVGLQMPEAAYLEQVRRHLARG